MPVSYDPILLKKIAQIYIETDDVFWDGFLLALERAADRSLREWRPIEEEPQFVALMNEFGRDAVLAALRDVRQIRLESWRRCSDRRVWPRGKHAMTHARPDGSEIKARV